MLLVPTSEASWPIMADQCQLSRHNKQNLTPPALVVYPVLGGCLGGCLVGIEELPKSGVPGTGTGPAAGAGQAVWAVWPGWAALPQEPSAGLVDLL